MLAMSGRLRNTKTLSEIRSFSTATMARKESSKKMSLHSRISPLGDPSLAMTPELDDWIETGKKVLLSEVKQIIHDLRKRRRFHHALEVSEWMNKKGICAFTPTEHAVQLDLIGLVNGFLEAEKYFNGLTEQDKTSKTYGALLHCYVRQQETEKALSLFQKMKENGLISSPFTYNDIMNLYVCTHEPDKVHDMLNEMKKNGVFPDNLSYRTLINVYEDKKGKMDTVSLQNISKEMEENSNITMDWNTYAFVANCYIRGNMLDKASDVLKKAEKLVEKDMLGYGEWDDSHPQVALYCRKYPPTWVMWGANISCPPVFGCQLHFFPFFSNQSQLFTFLTTNYNLPFQSSRLLGSHQHHPHFFAQFSLCLRGATWRKSPPQKMASLPSALGYNHLISLYTCLGNKDDVIRVWGLQKSVCKRPTNHDFIMIVTSLVRLGEFEEAEKVLTEWNSSGNVYDYRIPNIVIDGYVKKGLCDEAKDLLDRLAGDAKGTLPKSWGAVAVELIKKGDVGGCVSCIKSLMNVTSKRRWELPSGFCEKLFEDFGEKGCVDDVDALVKGMKNFMMFDREGYHCLMKGCINGGKEVGKLLEHMKDDGIEEDEETKKIIGLKQNVSLFDERLH